MPHHVSTQAFPFMQRAQARGADWAAALDGAVGEAAAAGLDGWEPIVRTPDQVETIGSAARRHGLSMPSIYIGGAMHEEDEGRATVANMLEIARLAVGQGTRFVVVNPNPIAWGSSENKGDAQLRVQLRLLAELGAGIAAAGGLLCYHTHDAEMRAGAREFHHMLLNSDPADVRLCLDPHWIWRGAGDSSVALDDIVTLYGDRVEMVHLRQSQGGVWDETVGPGDIDYEALMRRLHGIGREPLLVLERAIEPGMPETMSDTEAHRRSADYARQRLVRPAPVEAVA